MRKKVQVVLLCEDRQHRVFLRRFLEKARPHDHVLRIEMCRKTEGSAEQYVRTRFPIELVEHRGRNVSQVLIVMLDGDARGVDRRIKALEQACREYGCDVRQPSEAVLILVPTWNIETWLAYLGGQTVDEKKRDYPRLPRQRDCAPHVSTLVDMCRKNQLRQPAPASLAAACTEYRRWADSA